MPRTATIKRLRPTPEFPLDSHPEVSLDFTRVKQHLSKHGYKRPVLIVDLDIVRAKTRRFRAALPRVRPHFAVKANPDPRVLPPSPSSTSCSASACPSRRFSIPIR